MSTVCPRCGAEVDEAANYCMVCGGRITPVAEDDFTQRLKEVEQEKKSLPKKIADSFLKAIGLKENEERSSDIFYEPVSTQRLMPVEALFKDGIMRVDETAYSLAIKFDDVNYQAVQETSQINILYQWEKFLCSLDPSMQVQLFLNSKPIDARSFSNDLALSMVDGDPAGNVLRREQNAYVREKLSASAKSMRKTRLIIATVHATSYENAKRALMLFYEEVKKLFTNLKSTCLILNGKARARLILQMSRPNMNPDKFDYKNLRATPGLRSKDLLAPTKVLRVGNEDLFIGNRYCRSYTLVNYGNSSSDKFLTQINQLSYDVTISMHLQPWEHGAAKAFVNKYYNDILTENKTWARANTKPEYGVFIDESNMPVDRLEAIQEAEELRNAVINEDQHLFGLTTTITLYAETLDELVEADKEIRSIMSERTMPDPETWSALREAAFISSLPLGVDTLKRQYERNICSRPLSYFIPFTSVEIMDPGGIMLGINAKTHNFILYDPTLLEECNALFMAPPGSGKSFLNKLHSIQLALKFPSDDLISIDPEGENGPSIEALGGINILISPNSGNYINPFDVSSYYVSENDEYSSDIVHAKGEFIAQLMSLIMGELNATESNLIDAGCKHIFRAYLRSNDPEDLPTLVDLYQYMRHQESSSRGIDAHNVAEALEKYSVGSANIFAHQTNVNLSSRRINFDLHLLSGAHMKRMAMLIILDYIWQRVIKNWREGRRTWLKIDEAQYLLMDPSGLIVDWFNEFWMRGRKRGLYNIGILQNVSELMGDNRFAGRAEHLIQNSQFIAYLQQDDATADRIAAYHKLSDEQRDTLKVAPKGTGLYLIRNKAINFDYVIDPETCPTMYSICTTNFSDKAEPIPIKKLRGSYSISGELVETEDGQEDDDVAVEETADAVISVDEDYPDFIEDDGGGMQAVEDDSPETDAEDEAPAFCCPICGTPVEPHMAFCHACGSRLPQNPVSDDESSDGADLPVSSDKTGDTKRVYTTPW